MSWTDAYALKSGVNPSGATRELVSALDTAHGIFSILGQPFTVTSLSEGQHVPGSKHYIGQAADLRINNLDAETIPVIVAQLKSSLGPGYFVQLESDHIHMQYNGAGTALDYSPPSSGADLTAPAGEGFDVASLVESINPFSGSGDTESVVVDWGLLTVLGIAGFALWLAFKD